jgi:hypothetical protein
MSIGQLRGRLPASAPSTWRPETASIVMILAHVWAVSALIAQQIFTCVITLVSFANSKRKPQILRFPGGPCSIRQALGRSAPQRDEFEARR